MDRFFKKNFQALGLLFIFSKNICAPVTYKVVLISKKPAMPVFIKECLRIENQPLDLMQRVTNHKKAYDRLQCAQSGLIINPAMNLKQKDIVLVVPTVDQVGRFIKRLEEQCPLYNPFFTIYLPVEKVSSFIKSCAVLQESKRPHFYYIVPVGGKPKDQVEQMKVVLRKTLLKQSNDKTIDVHTLLYCGFSAKSIAGCSYKYCIFLPLTNPFFSKIKNV